MQSETIYVPNVKIIPLEIISNHYRINIAGSDIKYPKEVEEIGKPFNIITKNKLIQVSLSDNPFKETKEFKELLNPFGPLEYYLRMADVNFTLNKREDKNSQYLGLVTGKPTHLESSLKIGEFDKHELEFERSIIPCQFYLINDKL